MPRRAHEPLRQLLDGEHRERCFGAGGDGGEPCEAGDAHPGHGAQRLGGADRPEGQKTQ